MERFVLFVEDEWRAIREDFERGRGLMLADIDYADSGRVPTASVTSRTFSGKSRQRAARAHYSPSRRHPGQE
jgi:hypothetical protein